MQKRKKKSEIDKDEKNDERLEKYYDERLIVTFQKKDKKSEMDGEKFDVWKCFEDFKKVVEQFCKLDPFYIHRLFYC